jgi:hypothetical protein
MGLIQQIKTVLLGFREAAVAAERQSGPDWYRWVVPIVNDPG